MRNKTILVSSAIILTFLWPEMATAQDNQADESEDAAPEENGADDAEIKLGQVTVTARRREEQLSDVPTAASVISAQSLADRGGALTSGELLADQPSVRFNNLTSSITSEISIRASSTARATNGDPSIGLYRNGSYVGGGGIGGRNFALLDFLDIGRVEVLRGTQGALYGRNAVGGAVNIVTAKPEFEESGSLLGRYGIENQHIRLQGMINKPLTEHLAVRFSGEIIDQNDGFFYNPQNDVYFDHQEGFALRGQARYKDGPLDVTFSVEKQELTTPGIPYRVSIAGGSPAFPGGYQQDQFRYPWNTPPRASQDINGAQLMATVELGWANLTSTTLYRERNSQYDLDSDGLNPNELARAKAAGEIAAWLPLDANTSAYVIGQTDSLNQDLHLSGDAFGHKMQWLLGAEALVLDSDYSVESIRTPTPLAPSTGTISPVQLSYDSYAIYGSLGYDLTDQFNLTGEVRYTQDDRSINARLLDRDTNAPIGGAATMVLAGIEPDNLSYNATAAYKLSSDILLYGKTGTSYRAGGFNTRLGDPRQPIPIEAPYGDEISTSYEIGLKGNLANNAYFAVAAYSTDLEDLIIQTDNGCAINVPQCPVVATTFLTNAGNANSWGIEGEFSANYTLGAGSIRLATSASYQGGEVKSGKFDGVDLPQVPDWVASANLNYRRPVGIETEIFANIQFNGQWGGAQELLATSVDLDDYQLVNLRAGVQYRQVTFTVFSNNVFNDVHLIAQTPSILRYSQPRLTGMEVSYRW